MVERRGPGQSSKCTWEELLVGSALWEVFLEEGGLAQTLARLKRGGPWEAPRCVERQENGGEGYRAWRNRRGTVLGWTESPAQEGAGRGPW